ncbi:MAG: 30S ribosomal protein S6 [Bacteroidota bacterium]
MAQFKNAYETTFIVNAGLDDPQIDAVIEKVKDVVTKGGGTIRDIAKWGRKRFAYVIRRKNNGFYVVCEFTGPGDLIAKLERHYELDENIIRFLTITLDKNALQSRIKPSDLLKAPVTETVSTPPAAAAPAAAPAPVVAPPPAPAPHPAPAPTPAPAAIATPSPSTKPASPAAEEEDDDDEVA